MFPKLPDPWKNGKRMYRNLDAVRGVKPSRSLDLRRGVGRAIARSGQIFAAVCLLGTTAWGATVDIRCPRLNDSARGELEARARLFLTSADMESATIAVECDANSAWLVWTDNSKTIIDPRTNLVEGTLDAIEDRIAKAKRTSGSSGGGEATGTGAAEAGAQAGGRSTSEVPPDEPKPTAYERSGIDLEGGVGLAILTEFWTGAYAGGVGPRLDVGVGVGRKLAIVISEGARFAVGNGSGQMMTFDVQAGIAWGAPYQLRTGFGVMALLGAERLAASVDASGYGGLWTWAATGSLGLRGSLEMGPLDAWIGADAMLRSETIQTGQPKATAVPTLSAILSVGVFLPAFAGGTKNESNVPTPGK
jgi:hypothetical protein